MIEFLVMITLWWLYFATETFDGFFKNIDRLLECKNHSD